MIHPPRTTSARSVNSRRKIRTIASTLSRPDPITSRQVQVQDDRMRLGSAVVKPRRSTVGRHRQPESGVRDNHARSGGMAERPIAPVLKTGGASLLGSNPSPTVSLDRTEPIAAGVAYSGGYGTIASECFPGRDREERIAAGRQTSGRRTAVFYSVETRFSSSSADPVSYSRRTFSATISASRGQCSGE